MSDVHNGNDSLEINLYISAPSFMPYSHAGLVLVTQSLAHCPIQLALASAKSGILAQLSFNIDVSSHGLLGHVPHAQRRPQPVLKYEPYLSRP